MPLHCLSQTQIGYSLKEEQSQNSTKPEVLVTTLTKICRMPLHASKHGHALVKNTCIKALHGTIHVLPGSLVDNRRSSDPPNEH
jgi:hypothetical protein